MRKSLLFNTLLLMGTVFIAGCASDETARPDTQPPEDRVWTASVEAIGAAVGDMDDGMRALYCGGNSGIMFDFIWDHGDDNVEVYKGSALLGKLNPSRYGNETTTLTGTLSGALAVNDVLTLYLHGRAYDYTGQDGTLGSLSSKYTFQQSSTTVTEATSAGAVSFSVAKFDHAQAYWWLRLTDQDGVRIHPTKIEITSTGGKIVKNKAANGTSVYFTDADPFTITLSKEQDGGEYPNEAFLAIRNELGSADTYKFKAWVGEDVYVGPYDRALTYAVTNGNMSNMMRQMLKTTSATSLTIDAIPDAVYTGSAHTPTLTVKDGETTLVEGTDYSVAYSDNTAAGTATVTVTGLADSGDHCTTPYLGTKEVSFTILRADPAVTLDGSDVVIDNNGTSDRQVTAVTIADGSVSIMGDCSISYSSSDPTVATVDAATGKVTGVSSGTCTITATVASADNWNAATASYQVTVHTSANGTNSIDPWGDGNGEGLGGSIKL